MRRVRSKYTVVSEVTISLYTEVMAYSAEEATRVAAGRALCSIHHDGSDDESEVWMTSGELDGEPQNIRIG